MAKYAISEEGVSELQKLSKSIISDTEKIYEAGIMLKNSMSSLGKGLGIYENEIIDLVNQNQITLQTNRDTFKELSDSIAKKADEICSLIGFSITDIHNSSAKNNASNSFSANIKQTTHRPLIVNRDEQIDSIITDIKNGSNKDIDRAIAENIMDSIHDYSGPYYSEIRYAYKNQFASKKLKDKMECVDAYINNVSKWSGTIFRGINVSRDVAEKILKSKTIDMLGPSSWSTSESVAQQFSLGHESVRMVFILEDNQSGASITHLATFNGSEEEVLAPSGIQYIADIIEEIFVDEQKYVYVHVHEQRR